MPLEKTFDAAARERAIYEAWEAAGAFRAGAGAKLGAEPFSVMIPPPNVTGALHMGHAFNNTLQDILVRWHRMRGHDTLWQPGTDHAGIATQMVVERELAKEGNLGRRELGRDKFIERVWEQKRKSRGNIRSQLERLGASCDWSREAFTMGGAPGDPDAGEGPNFHDAVLRVFVDWYEKGLIYRGKRLVNWDPHFETAISDLEVENVEVDGFMWHFRYPLAGGATYEYVEKDEDGTVILRETRDWISIATTRPETMLGDGAVAVHPSDERYAPIVGQLCEIPVGPKEHRRLIPIITDDYPDPLFGSGAVKITGAHDFNDYGVAQRNGIPLYRLMDTKARMRDDGQPYAEAAATAGRIARRELDPASVDIDSLNLVPDELRGLDRFEARKRVVEAITAEGLAVVVKNPRFAALEGAPADPVAPEPETIPLVEAKKIVQPFGDRSKVVIEPMLTDQWFVDTAKIVQPAIDAVCDERTTILPERDAKTYFHWLENIEPWCISRQLWWGHQIPVWYGPKIVEDALGNIIGLSTNGDDRIPFCAISEDGAKEAAARYYPADTAIEISRHPGVNFQVEGERSRSNPSGTSIGSPATLSPTRVRLDRDPDVLDTWFSSGLWPIGTLGWPQDTPELRRYFPTSVLVTGFDIIFFWVARMMMMQLEIVKEVPFETVYVHALVRDEKGKKMSKSLGNVLDPLDLIDGYGADAVRFTLAAMAAMGRDLRLSEDRIAGYRNFVTKLWNAHRFAEMNGVFEHERMPGPSTDGAQVVPPSEATETANRWIIGETARVRAEVDEALGAFRFDAAAGTLYAFVWGRVCDWYLELTKPLLEGEKAEETRAVTAWVLDQCLLMLHPFMPFVTEELWALSGKRGGLLALAEWPNYGAELLDDAAQSEMMWVISLIEGIRSARGEVNVPPAARAPLIPVEVSDVVSGAWRKNMTLIERLARVQAAAGGAAPRGSLTVTVEGATFALPVADLIDVAAEKARLAKAKEKLSKEMTGLSGRLKNPRFLESAPEEVVLETRETLAAKEDETTRLRAALARLEELA